MTEADRPGEEDWDKAEADVLRHMPSPIADPWAWLSEGMGQGILGRLKRLRQQSTTIPGTTDLGESEGVIHPEPVPPPPGPRNPQEPQP